MEQNYKKYDVVLVNFGTVVFGSEQAGIRPALIVQNDAGNFFGNTTIVMPFSSSIKKMRQPTHAFIGKNKKNGLKKDSVLLGECLRQISEERIIEYIGTFSNEYEISEVKRVCKAIFGE